MAMTKSQLASQKREEVLALFTKFLKEQGEEVMRESGNALVFPSTDNEGNELYVKVAVSIPRGDRSGEAYDGYAAAQDYAMHCQEVAERREQAEKEKAEAAAKRKARQEEAKRKKEAAKKKGEGEG